MRTYVCTSGPLLLFRIDCELLPSGLVEYGLIEDTEGCFDHWDPSTWPDFLEFLEWCRKQRVSSDPHTLLEIDEGEFRWVPQGMADLLEPSVEYTPGGGFMVWCEDEPHLWFETYEEASFESCQEKIAVLLNDYKDVVGEDAFDYVLGYLYLRAQEFES